MSRIRAYFKKQTSSKEFAVALTIGFILAAVPSYAITAADIDFAGIVTEAMTYIAAAIAAGVALFGAGIGIKSGLGLLMQFARKAFA